MDKITLTQRELDDLKDNIKFKTDVALRLKRIEIKIDSVSCLEKKLSHLDAAVKIYGVVVVALIAGVVSALVR